MTNISNELKVAITVVASVLVAIVGFRFMQDLPIFRQSHRVHTYFDRVDGLSTGNVVYISGVKVGSVQGIQLSSSDSVRVTMGFDLGVTIPMGSVAILESSGILDEKAIIIQRGNSTEEVPYDGYIMGVYRGGIMESLEEEGERLSENLSSSFDRLNMLLERLNLVVTQENRENIGQTLSSLEAATDEFAQLMENRRRELESGIEHANSILANLDTMTTDNRERVDTMLVQLNRSLSEIETLSHGLSTTSGHLNDILEKVERGDGTLGRLVNDPSLYNSYDSLATELQTLIKNINEDPARFLKHMRLIEVF